MRQPTSQPPGAIRLTRRFCPTRLGQLPLVQAYELALPPLGRPTPVGSPGPQAIGACLGQASLLPSGPFARVCG